MSENGFSRDWCLNMAEREGNAEIGAGSPDHLFRTETTARARAHVAAMRIVQANPVEALVRLMQDAKPQDDTVAFVQDWMMSGEHEPNHWHRDFAAAIDARSAFSDAKLQALAERFCANPLPETVCADLVAIKPMSGRTGTNLMTVVEAKEMLRAALTTTPARNTSQIGEG